MAREQWTVYAYLCDGDNGNCIVISDSHDDPLAAKVMAEDKGWFIDADGERDAMALCPGHRHEYDDPPTTLVINEREQLVHDDPELRESIERGMADAAAGRVVSLGSFTGYVDDIGQMGRAEVVARILEIETLPPDPDRKAEWQQLNLRLSELDKGGVVD